MLRLLSGVHGRLIPTWGYMWAQGFYRPRLYHGPVDLFVSDELAALRTRPFRGWDKYARQIREHRVPGRHQEIVHQYRDQLGEAFQLAMGDA